MPQILASPSAGANARRARVGAFLVLVATLGSAFKGIFAHVAYERGLPTETVLLLRMILAAPIFALALAWRLREPRLRSLPRALWLRAAAVGVLFASSGAVDFFAIERIGAGPSRVILFSHPALVLAWQALREHRPPTRVQTLAFVGAWIGLWFAAGMGPGSAQMRLDPLGVGLSMLSAVGYAGYLIASQGLMRRMGSAPFICAANLSGMTYVLLGEWSLGLLPEFNCLPSAGWPPVLGLVLLSTVLPAFAFTEGLHRLGPARASLLSLVGPPTTVAAAAILLGEAMSTSQLIGCALVLASISRLKSPSPRATKSSAASPVTCPARPRTRDPRPHGGLCPSASAASARL